MNQSYYIFQRDNTVGIHECVVGYDEFGNFEWSMNANHPYRFTYREAKEIALVLMLTYCNDGRKYYATLCEGIESEDFWESGPHNER